MTARLHRGLVKLSMGVVVCLCIMLNAPQLNLKFSIR